MEKNPKRNRRKLAPPSGANVGENAGLVPVSGATHLAHIQDMGANGRSLRPAMNFDASPIYLHSSFRTSSTWLWAKIRAAPHVAAYYEVFNEALEYMDVSSASSVTYQSWESRHPSAAPYFMEFLPLLKPGGGVPAYAASMAFGSFIPAGGIHGDLSPAETAYVGLLIRSAHANRKIPVLSCTRSLGRVAAIGRAFPGRNVFCFRNLFHQWASYSALAMSGNMYYLETVDMSLKGSRHDAFLAIIDDWTAGRTISPTDPKMFQAFVLLHLYLYAHAYEASDLVVDVTALARDPELRQTVEARLSQMVNAPMDLSDARETFEISPLVVRNMSEMRDVFSQFTKMIRGTCQSERGADFAEQIKDATIAEWERHEFFVRGARAAASDALATETRRLDEATAGASTVAAERDAIAGQLAAVSEVAEARLHQAQALDAAQAAIAAERDGLAQQLAEALAGQAALRQENEALVAQRDAADQARAAVDAAHGALQATHAGIVAERDGLAHQITEAVAAQAALRQECEALAAERDAAAQARGALEAAHAGIVAERDGLAHQIAEAVAAQAALRQECEALAAERDAAAQARGALEAAHAGIVAERDGLAHQITEAVAAQAALRQECEALIAERDAAVQACGLSEAAHGALEAAYAAIVAERDGLAQQLAEAVAAQAALHETQRATMAQHAAAEAAGLEREQTIASLTAERDELARRVAATEAALGSSQVMLSTLTSEHRQIVQHLHEARTQAEVTQASLSALTAERDALNRQVSEALAPPPAGVVQETISRFRRLMG